MWSGKMAARWRGEDGDLNAGNSEFLASNTPNEQSVLSRRDVEGVAMDTQSCMDHSILALFEDSTVTSEDKSGAEEESETLLSALTEMLDSVEDDDGTPFDTLPDTELLTHPERRDRSVETSLADRLRPRSKSPNVTFTIKIEGEKEDESRMERSSPPQLLGPQSQTLFHSKNKKAEAEVAVFTSTSLVNLVKIMHPYCLRLHVEEKGDNVRRKRTLFSHEEVWKYETPTEECDEEINVVSDDEETTKGTKREEEADEKSGGGKLLKSALLNGSSSRAKKRVSFGHVQVAACDEPVETGLPRKNLTSGHTSEATSVPLSRTEALENAAVSAPEAQTPSSEVNGDKTEAPPPRGEAKAKSLSLQQYRQLCQKRKPLVEKQRNYTTKWPYVSAPPTELTPILCLQGQRQNSCGPKTAHRRPDGRRSGADQLQRSQTRTPAPPGHHPSEAKPPTHLHRSGLQPRSESKLIPHASPLQDVTANTNVIAPESKISPAKKPTLLSSDPPNPVLLPLPVIQTSPPPSEPPSPEPRVEFLNRGSNLDSTRHFQEIQSEPSGASLQTQPKSEVSLLNRHRASLFRAIKNTCAEIASGVSSRSPALFQTTTQIQSSPEREKRRTQKSSPTPTPETELEPKTPLSPSPDTARQIKDPSGQPPSPVPAKETSPEVHPGKSPAEEPPLALQFSCGGRSAAADSGIEAPDLTSLLEQFEETQAKEVGARELKLVSASSPANLQTDGHLDLVRASRLVLTPPVEPLKPLSTSKSPGIQNTLRAVPHVQTSAGVDIPEPLGTDIILSTRPDLPARRKHPPFKAIQIIDPRPLPPKRTHPNLPEFPAAHTSAHSYSSVSSDHDYCGPLDRSPTSATQRSRTSRLKDILKSADESQATPHDSSAAAECNKRTSIVAVNDAAKSVTQHPSEQPRTRPETNPSTVLSPPHNAATDQDCAGAAEDQAAPCTLPTPPPSPPVRGREKRRYRRRSPHSDSSCSCCSDSSSPSSSSSASPSPKRQKHRHTRSKSSSCSPSSSSRSVSRSPPRRNRWSYCRSRCSRSRSRSWSQSRSPSRSQSPSPRVRRRQWRDVYSSRESRKLRREHDMRIQKLKAIDERRVVYVGRICRSMTHDELRERFTQFGEVECVSLHFRDRGDHYGFVTFYNMEDAFAAIDNGGKLRRPDELPFDICFGGRRQFCNSHYADLDANKDADADPPPAKSRCEDIDFDSLLKQAQRGLKR